jgi:hypothetical protein
MELIFPDGEYYYAFHATILVLMQTIFRASRIPNQAPEMYVLTLITTSF